MKMSKGKIVLLTSIILIVLVIAFYVFNSVANNPLEGKWVSEDAGYAMEIDDDGDAELVVEIKNTAVDVDLFYTMNKEAKTITFKGKPESFEEAAKDTDNALLAAEIDAYLEKIMTTFDYSLENNTLTLTEREYGDQFIFTKVK